jgi:RHS repeat-associated protein
MLVETIGTESTSYVYGGDLLAQREANSPNTYYHADGLGSVRAMSDSTGVISTRYSYDAFGRTRAQEGLARNPYQFTGQQVDAETGLVYLRARYYDPAIGRFLSRDPVLTEHPYAYVGNNPISRVDLEGHFWHVVGGAVVGAGVYVIGQGVSNVLSGRDWNEGITAEGLAKGAVKGAIAAAIPGVGGALFAAGFEAGVNATARTFDDGQFTLADAAASLMDFGTESARGLSTVGVTQLFMGSATKFLHPTMRVHHLGQGFYVGHSGSELTKWSAETSSSFIEEITSDVTWDAAGKILSGGLNTLSGLNPFSKQDVRYPALWQQLRQPEVAYAANVASGSTGQYSGGRGNGVGRQDTKRIFPQTQPGPIILQGTSPRKPAPTWPSDWYLERSGGQVQLCAQHNGSPDQGVSITHYVFRAGGAGWPGFWESPPTPANCVTTSSLASGSYPWQVRVIDNRGLISEWSDVRHFTIGSTALTLDDLVFSGSADSDLVFVYTCARSDVLGNNLKIYANTATDGSANGEWYWIDPGGQICMDRNNVDSWARWDTPDLGAGTHRIRAIAYRGTIEDGTYVEAVTEATFTLSANRRPGRTLGLSPMPNPIGVPIEQPGDGQWFNTRTITFRWEPFRDERIQYYRLNVSTGTDPNTNPIVTQTFNPSVRSYTHIFDQDYPRLAWLIEACKDDECGYGPGGPL